MSPPKAKIHKGNIISKPPQVEQHFGEPSTSSSSSTTSLTAEQERQLETELCWCINQLQNALKSNKLNNKQVQDHTKALNTLMSNTAPLIKKRQVMRLSFGDYRAKMAADEKKTQKITLKVASAQPSAKSMFIRKAIITPSANSFKFNFPSMQIDDEIASNSKEVDEPMETQVAECSIKKTETDNLKNSAFGRSNNSFRFNFTVEDN